MPKELTAAEDAIAYIHAFIYALEPQFMVIPSVHGFEQVEAKPRQSIHNWTSNWIRDYLDPAVADESEYYDFQSPYVLPDDKITFKRVHENRNFIILERMSET